MQCLNGAVLQLASGGCQAAQWRREWWLLFRSLYANTLVDHCRCSKALTIDSARLSMKSSPGIERFTAFWGQLVRAGDTHIVHPDDRAVLTEKAAARAALQTHLVPLPVNGKLLRADVVIAMTNSGYGKGDAAWERRFKELHAQHVESKWRNVHQTHTPKDEYPFYDLDPRFRDHPGAAYWKGGAVPVVPIKRQQAKLKCLATELARIRGQTIDEVHRALANRLAVLELVPYASVNIKKLRGIHKYLPSSQEAIKLLHGLAAEREKLVVVARSTSEFGFNHEDSRAGLVVYGANHALSASLGKGGAAFSALLERLSRS